MHLEKAEGGGCCNHIIVVPRARPISNQSTDIIAALVPVLISGVPHWSWHVTSPGEVIEIHK